MILTPKGVDPHGIEDGQRTTGDTQRALLSRVIVHQHHFGRLDDGKKLTKEDIKSDHTYKADYEPTPSTFQPRRNCLTIRKLG